MSMSPQELQELLEDEHTQREYRTRPGNVRLGDLARITYRGERE